MPKDNEAWYKKLSGILGIVVVVIGLITTLFAIDSRYAKCQDLQQQKIDTSKTLQQIRIDMRQDRYLDRYDRLKSRKKDLEYQVKRYPNDRDLKNDLEETKEELAIARQQINEMEKIQTRQQGKFDAPLAPAPAKK